MILTDCIICNYPIKICSYIHLSLKHFHILKNICLHLLYRYVIIKVRQTYPKRSKGNLGRRRQFLKKEDLSHEYEYDASG